MKHQLTDIICSLKHNNILFLTYHSISNYNHAYCVNPIEFKNQMHGIAKLGLKVISIQEAVIKIIGNNIDQKYVVLTFDDGYFDNFKNALPILLDLNFKASFFIVTNALGKFNNWDNWPLKLMGIHHLEKFISLGFTIGAHTHNHANLNFNILPKKIEQELYEPYNILSNQLNLNFIPFSFPYGSGANNSLIYNTVKNIYDCAVVSGGFWGNNSYSELWRLKRILIDRKTNSYIFNKLINRNFDLNYFKNILKY
jgi:peptidoglycan/xylan/chitin deacetylase (PgdA/CDA1 family)